MIKYSPSNNALLVAQQYLQHEFRKIFYDIKNPKIWNKLDKSINNYAKREGEGSFWLLVASISEGWKLKEIYNITSSTKYKWKLREIPVSKIILTGMSPTIDKYTIKKYKRNPLAFARAWKKDKKMRKEILDTGFSRHKERDRFPVLVFQTRDGFQVFDGMRRTLLALINKKDKIRAWVGYNVNPRGKSLISGDRCYFLSNIYTRSKNKDKNLEKSIIRIGKEIIAQHRNGKETLMNRVAGWSRNPEIKRIFAKMLK